MNKNELELRKIAIRAESISRGFQFLERVAALGTIALCIYLIMAGLVQFVGHQPEAIKALAMVVEKLKINAMLGYIVAIIASTGYVYERKGKQRAYKQLGEKRAQLEKDDPHNGSSNLDSNGRTPTATN